MTDGAREVVPENDRVTVRDSAWAIALVREAAAVRFCAPRLVPNAPSERSATALAGCAADRKAPAA